MNEQDIRQTIQHEIQQAQQPLLDKIDAADEWAQGVYLLLEQILPPLLRGHPEAETIQRNLQRHDDRYEELQAHPERGEEGETAGQYEAAKMLNRRLALLGVWPNIDPGDAVRKTLEPFGR